ncbi:MAG TPA: protein-S-isoprenylcysteine O-methyltransferase [Hyphomonadaceae bacterium]|nr:protein-S-isoprenylcysteine O-methyltransferase [Hyphomonadaceae bacterium]
MMTVNLAKIVWVLGVVAWYMIRYPYQRRAAKFGVARSAGGTGDRVALTVSAIGQFLIPAIYVVTGQPAFADYPQQPVLAWLGLIALIASLALFRVTHRQLGRNWSVTLETRASHALVTDGLYSFVRHPMYSSFLLFALAQALLLPNWVAGLSGLVGTGVLFFYRVNKEEALMAETFGTAYREYCSRTARIIPWVY